MAETTTTPENWCHDTRKQIDAVIQRVKLVKPSFDAGDIKGAREIEKVYTYLQEAKMWTGKILEELGSELPAQYQDKAE